MWARFSFASFPSFWVGHMWVEGKKRKGLCIYKTEQNVGRFSFAFVHYKDSVTSYIMLSQRKRIFFL